MGKRKRRPLFAFFHYCGWTVCPTDTCNEATHLPASPSSSQAHASTHKGHAGFLHAPRGW